MMRLNTRIATLERQQSGNPGPRASVGGHAHAALYVHRRN